MFGEELQVQDLLSAGGQAAQQMRLAATRCSAHHHQLQFLYKEKRLKFLAVLWIRIRGIHMFLGLSDPDLLVRDTDPDPSIIKQR
jgi:hypothetical protein